MSDKPTWIITASGDRPVADVAADLRKVAGVADVAPDAPVDIGPPD